MSTMTWTTGNLHNLYAPEVPYCKQKIEDLLFVRTGRWVYCIWHEEKYLQTVQARFPSTASVFITWRRSPSAAQSALQQDCKQFCSNILAPLNSCNSQSYHTYHQKYVRDEGVLHRDSNKSLPLLCFSVQSLLILLLFHVHQIIWKK